MRRIPWLLLVVSACGPAIADDEVVTGDPCEGTQARCAGETYQTCQNDVYIDVQECAATCLSDYGCVDCDPSYVQTCRGDEAWQCNSDGTLGDYVETCALESCSYGQCAGAGECQDDGTQLIYVVDATYRLLSFDPAGGAYEFTLIGNLDCPASPAWPDHSSGPGSPFSMSVDRNARAWVLYTSGELFLVDTADASCESTTFEPGKDGFELFGMGFVSDDTASTGENLFIAGGSAADITAGDLAFIDPETLDITVSGPMQAPEYSPELTGTGAGELYGYYPGVSETFVARIDKATGENVEEWDLPALGNQVAAWAFAHWGGQFFMFVTTQNGFGIQNSKVILLDPETGDVETLLEDLPYVIVGAGVSTCAPITIE